MPKPTNMDTSKKPIMLRLSSWYKEWWRWLKSRERQTISRRWDELQFLSAIVFIFIAIFGLLVFIPPYNTVLSPPRALEQMSMVITWAALGVIGLVFVISCAVVFGLSFHPKTRRIADGYFHFRDLTEMEELKMRVSTIESGLASVEESLGAVEKRLDNIEGRLGTIETILKSLVSKKTTQGSKND